MPVSETTDSSFISQVLESPQPVIVDFWAPWCGPCRAVAPVLEALSSEHPEWKFVKLNVDENPQTAASFSIQAIPTLLVFANGQNCGRIQGAHPKDSLERMIGQAL